MVQKSVPFCFEKVYGDGLKISFKEFIDFPLCHPSNWLLSRLILDNNIPKFAEEDLSASLNNFIKEHEKACVDDNLTKLYDNLLSDANKPTEIAESLQKLVKERISTRFQTEPPTDEEIFGQTYTKIVNSPAAMDLIQLEHSFAVAIQTEVIERGRALRDLQRKALEATENLLSTASAENNVADAVSDLQRRFHTDYEIQKMTWNSRISDLKESQRQDYRNFVMSIEEQMLQSDLSKSLPPKPSDLGVTTGVRGEAAKTSSNAHKSGPRSENFMIQLGRQLRSFYNLKFVEADPMDLMTPIGGLNPASSVEATVSVAERLSSALTIYSNELTGLIILVDSQWMQSKDQQRLAEVCEVSTDFHFPEFDRQLTEIQEAVRTLSEGGTQDTGSKGRLKPGDVYVTRHSNLHASEIGGRAGGGGGIEVVFHVVTEGETLAGSGGGVGDGSSPSLPSHLHSAIARVLRVCTQHGIGTLSMPLLLTKRRVESLPLTWCQRRAETVLKIIKGTLMEASVGLRSGSPSPLRTLIFLLPPPPTTADGDSVFDRLRGLVNSTFQLTNPIIVDSAGSVV